MAVHILRVIFALMLSASLAGVMTPLPVNAAPAPQKTMSCCAHMVAAPGADHHCEHGTPSQNQQDQHCCQACAIGLAFVFIAAQPFVYPQTGEEHFAASEFHQIDRFDRPPVPPPRSALS